MNTKEALLKKIRERTVRTAVIGLGYVGLPLAVEFARCGFSVVGIDIDQTKVDDLNAGRSYILDVQSETVRALRDAGKLTATTDFAALETCDTVDICVPTPLRKTRDPDLSYVVGAAEAVVRHLHRGQLVILESTTYPGTTDELVQPMLEKESGLKAGRDYFLAFSPERVDPGPAYRQYNIRNVPKVVGGVTPDCTEVACALYGQAIDTIVPVANSRVAEMVKLLENTYRSVNIGLVNELALMCHTLGLDVWQVIEAAATKPYGFQAFYPGPGLGGHCIPIDPFYLAWKARAQGFEPRFIELAGQINSGMPRFVVSLVADALNSVRKPLNGSAVHVLGVAYKKDVGDIRESPALEIVHDLKQRKAKVTYTDPYIPRFSLGAETLESVALDDGPLARADCVVVVTNHACFPWDRIRQESALIVDTRNALKGCSDPKIWRL